MKNEVSNKNLEESVKKWDSYGLTETIKTILLPMYAPYLVGKLHSLGEPDQIDKVIQYVTAGTMEFVKIAIGYELFR